MEAPVSQPAADTTMNQRGIDPTSASFRKARQNTLICWGKPYSLNLNRNLVPAKETRHERGVVLIHHQPSLGREAFALESLKQVSRNSNNLVLTIEGNTWQAGGFETVHPVAMQTNSLE